MIMKIKCDVCDKDEVSVFFTADEAALCDACEHRVHHANKLASKHERLSLLYPSSSKDSPLCDICQEKIGFLFCQQDRAILCGDCDMPIHTANEHTKKHNRFILTGVKLSATSTIYKPSLHDSPVDRSNLQPLIEKHVSVTHTNSNQSSFAKPSSKKTAIKDIKGDDNQLVNQTSTIPDYLIDTLPGWLVEDFLDTSLSPFSFCKNDNGMRRFLEADFDSSKNIGPLSSENSGIWVPQTPTSLYQNQFTSQISGQLGFIKEAGATPNMKLGNRNKRLLDDGGFTVPQISSQCNGSKRSSAFW